MYDTEAQKKNKGRKSTCRRSRFYQALVDVNLMKPGEDDFRKLNDTYIIFICPFDLFGHKKYKYTFRMKCDEVAGLEMDDGAVRIFLNTRGKKCWMQKGMRENCIQLNRFVGIWKITANWR